jgi:hypothetical protein
MERRFFCVVCWMPDPANCWNFRIDGFYAANCAVFEVFLDIDGFSTVNFRLIGLKGE